MFTRILTTALLAGAAAGLLAGLLQLWFVQPVLLHAEMYESGELVHFGAEAAHGTEAHADDAAHTHETGLARPLLLILFNMLTYAGYGLILVALMSLAEGRGAVLDARHGVFWGVAGFVAVMLAPGFSLAPEVPGVAAADVVARQVWWGATVAMAGAVGAPEPEAFAGPVPPEIGALFAARVFGVGLAGWVLTGLFAGWLWARDGAVETPARA